VRVGWHPSIEPRLVRAAAGREDLAAYLAAGGYRARVQPERLLEAVERSGLRGRGGAAFSVAVKWKAIAQQPGGRHVIANGEEGEPTSWKDRYLLRTRPHLVIDGMLHAASAVGATDLVIYLSDAEAERSARKAVAELKAAEMALSDDLHINVFAVAPAYVAGEETAAVRAIDGGPPKPLAKPPRPFERGLSGEPTLVQNVETLANLPFIARHGAEAFRECGTHGSPGTILFTANGRCTSPGLYELPLGISLSEAFDVAGGVEGDGAGFLMGGYFAGLLGPRGFELPLDYDVLRATGSGLGCAAVTALGGQDCPVNTAAEVMSFFAEAQAEQCGTCTRGTAAMAATLRTLAAGGADEAEAAMLQRWSVSLRGRGACALLDGAAALAGSLLREFPAAVQAHLDLNCVQCGLPRRRGEVESSPAKQMTRGASTSVCNTIRRRS